MGIGHVGICLTLKICGRLNESEVDPRLSDDGHQECEGVDTQGAYSLAGQISKPPLPKEHDCGRSNTIIS